MNLSKLIKENFVLLIGLLAPVLLMVFFFVAASFHNIPALKTADMHYDALFSTDSWQNNSSISAKVFVEKNTLYTQYEHEKGVGNMPKLFLYEATRGTLRQLDFPPPNASDESVFGKNTLVESTKMMKLDTRLTSPDGVEFSYCADDYPHNGGLVNELLIGGSYSNNRSGQCFKRGGSSLPMPSNVPGYTYQQLQFIGWVVGTQVQE